MNKLEKIKTLAKKLSASSGATIEIGTEIVGRYKLLETEFSTVNSLIGGIPKGRFTTIAG